MWFWCVLLLLLAERLLVELELDVRDISDGNRLELSILICSCTLRTHTEITSSFIPSSCRKGCCYGNHHGDALLCIPKSFRGLTSNPSMPGLALGSFCMLHTHIHTYIHTYIHTGNLHWGLC